MLTPSPPISPLGKPWPEGPAQRGKYYGVNDPIYQGTMLCVMTMETWTDFGTLVQKLKKALVDAEAAAKAQNTAIQELKAANIALAAQHGDAMERLQNLREQRRKEMRADLEQEIILPTGNGRIVSPYSKG